MRRFAAFVTGVLIAAALIGVGPAAACSQVGNAYVLTGDAAAVAGGRVTYRVDEVVLVDGAAAAALPRVGDQVTVGYRDDDARFVHAGDRYQVGVVVAADGTLESSVVPVCGDGFARTAHADGTPLDTGFLGPDGIRSWPATLPLVALVLAVVVAASVIARRRARRHPGVPA